MNLSSAESAEYLSSSLLGLLEYVPYTVGKSDKKGCHRTRTCHVAENVWNFAYHTHTE